MRIALSLAVALALGVGFLAKRAAGEAKPEKFSVNFNSLLCRSFLAMNDGQRGIYLIGLYDGFQSADYWVRNHLDLDRELKEGRDAAFHKAQEFYKLQGSGGYLGEEAIACYQDSRDSYFQGKVSVLSYLELERPEDFGSTMREMGKRIAIYCERPASSKGPIFVPWLHARQDVEPEGVTEEEIVEQARRLKEQWDRRLKEQGDSQ